MRLEVFSRDGYPDGRAIRLLSSLSRAFPIGARSLDIVDVFIIDGIPSLPEALLREVFSDSVSQDILIDGAAADAAGRRGWDLLVEITARPGVTDPVALTAREALRLCLADSGGLPDGAGSPRFSIIHSYSPQPASRAANGRKARGLPAGIPTRSRKAPPRWRDTICPPWRMRNWPRFHAAGSLP
jgi:hypothetical protein